MSSSKTVESSATRDLRMQLGEDSDAAPVVERAERERRREWKLPIIMGR